MATCFQRQSQCRGCVSALSSKIQVAEKPGYLTLYGIRCHDLLWGSTCHADTDSELIACFFGGAGRYKLGILRSAPCLQLYTDRGDRSLLSSSANSPSYPSVSNNTGLGKVKRTAMAPLYAVDFADNMVGDVLPLGTRDVTQIEHIIYVALHAWRIGALRTSIAKPLEESSRLHLAYRCC